MLPTRLRIIAVAIISPNFTAGSIVVLTRGDEILLLRQRHHPAWSLPGGLLDAGEAPSLCVMREVKEELGVDIVVDARPAAVLVEGRRIDIVFTAPWPYESRAVVPRDDEVLEGRWFRADALPSITGPTRRALAAVGPAARA